MYNRPSVRRVLQNGFFIPNLKMKRDRTLCIIFINAVLFYT